VEDQPTTLWTLERDGREASCRVRLVPYGIEVDLLRDGAAIVTRTFDNGEEALAWADRKRAVRQAQGWHEVCT
jgi:hypothetical protein